MALPDCNCKVHTFLSYDKMSCISCPTPCINCHGNSFDNPVCESCQDDKMILPLNCGTCIAEYYMTIDMKKCQACPETCLHCKGLSNDKPYCTECRDKQMFVDSTFVCECNERLFFEKVNKKCLPCEDRCYNCTAYGNDHCTSCNVEIRYNDWVKGKPGVCDCDSSHEWRDKVCKIKAEPNKLWIIIISCIVGMIVIGMILYVVCIH